ncbi:MAG: LysR family transcriptional regulator [Bdellovibrionaceae bacterium]|nr:LysR family transcriptional regulator [Pseudobdellovibrionaceae bacterium]
MEITLEQAKVFDAVARLGTIQKAAQELNKAHSAIIYSLKTLEEQTQLTLMDRSGHRNRITLQGQIVLKYCRRLLGIRGELEALCAKMKGGWEPSLKLIYDGIVDFNFIGDALFVLNEMKAPTEVKVLSAHLHEVEDLFSRENADIMVTILPLQRLQIPCIRLKPIQMHLVAHRDHPLGAYSGRRRIGSPDLNRHTFITIKTAQGQVGLSTEQMKFDSYFYVNGFMTKKMAIMKQLGFGWLPDYLTRDELKAGSLRMLKTEIDNKHTVFPLLYHRPEEAAGKAARGTAEFFPAGAFVIISPAL